MHCVTTDPPRIAIIGAGIAGLTLSAWLRHAGLESTVYEQAPARAVAGAGIQLSPNAVGLLGRLGLGPALDAVAVRPEAVETRRWRDGAVVAWTELGPGCQAHYGAPYLTLHRADLHACLLAAQPPGTVRTGRRLVGLRELPTGVALDFADGGRALADLVVGADGIGSLVRGTLSTDRPRYSGTSVYRGLVPVARIPASTFRSRVTVWLGPMAHCVWYPVRGGRLLSVAAVVRDGAGPPPRRGEGDPAAMLAAFMGWHVEVTAVLAELRGVTRWALHDRAPLPSWHSAHVTVVGDAAHPMLPFGAHGASQAIESAVTLATCLAGGGDIAQALRRYEAVRMPRLDRVTATVARNAGDHHLADGRAQRARDAAMPERSGLHRQAWLYGYDAEAATLATMAPAASPARTAVVPAPTAPPVRDPVTAGAA